jgi:hypothetical protein
MQCRPISLGFGERPAVLAPWVERRSRERNPQRKKLQRLAGQEQAAAAERLAFGLRIGNPGEGVRSTMSGTGKVCTKKTWRSITVGNAV